MRKQHAYMLLPGEKNVPENHKAMENTPQAAGYVHIPPQPNVLQQELCKDQSRRPAPQYLY
jgi:hypothetical protein